MPVPKRKVSKARRDQRSAHKNIDPQPFVYCPNAACKNEPLLPHMACPRCGFYRKRKVLKGEIDQEVQREQAARAVAAPQAETKAEHQASAEDAQQSGE